MMSCLCPLLASLLADKVHSPTISSLPGCQPSQRKNSENREQSQTGLNYAEVHPVLQELKNTAIAKKWTVYSQLGSHIIFCFFRFSGCFPVRVVEWWGDFVWMLAYKQNHSIITPTTIVATGKTGFSWFSSWHRNLLASPIFSPLFVLRWAIWPLKPLQTGCWCWFFEKLLSTESGKNCIKTQGLCLFLSQKRADLWWNLSQFTPFMSWLPE